MSRESHPVIRSLVGAGLVAAGIAGVLYEVDRLKPDWELGMPDWGSQTHGGAEHFNDFAATDEQAVDNISYLTLGSGEMSVVGSGKVDVQCGTFDWCQGANPFNIGVDGTDFLHNVPVKVRYEPCISLGAYTDKLVTGNTGVTGTPGEPSPRPAAMKIDLTKDSDGKVTGVRVDAGTLFPCFARIDENDPVTAGRFERYHFVDNRIGATFENVANRLILGYAETTACPENIVDLPAATKKLKAYAVGQMIMQFPDLKDVISNPANIELDLQDATIRRQLLMPKFDQLISHLSQIDRTLEGIGNGKQIEMQKPTFGNFDITDCKPVDLNIKGK